MCQLIRISSSNASNLVNVARVLTLGSFDGFHLGHQLVFKELVKNAKANSLTSSVLTFYPHPSVRLKKAAEIPKITNLRQRLALLSELNVDEFIVMNFTSKLSQMPWQEFCEQILSKQLNVSTLIIGADARIGKNALGTVQVLPDFLKTLGIETKVVGLKANEGGQKYASRQVRSAILAGELDSVSSMLGRNYQLNGKVIKGRQIGRTLGFPTANIHSSKMALLPTGVYIVKAWTDTANILQGVMNVGFKPTVNSNKNSSKPTVEVHLFDFNGDIYGKSLTIEVLQKLRNEQKFASLEQLKEQIQKDCQAARQFLGNLFDFEVSQKTRLDKFLVEVLTADGKKISRSKIEQIIKSGFVKVNGVKQQKPGYECMPDDHIQVELKLNQHDDSYIQSQEMPLEILFEDDSVLVINKKANMMVHPGAGNKEGTILNGVKNYLTKQFKAQSEDPVSFPPRYGLVHRLDKDTTGVLLFAKTEESLVALQEQFANRTVNKKYVALVYLPKRGKHPFRDEDHGVIETPIARDQKNRTKMCINPAGKYARTDWKVLERFSQAALLEITLHTGRTHQIRVHMESLGSGVLGDKIYGLNNFKLEPKVLQIIDSAKYQLLHARYLCFIHPKTNNKIEITSNLPGEFQQVIEDLRLQQG